MRWHKIYGMIYMDFVLLKNVKWKLFEFIYFPITTLIIWGLFSIYSSEFALEAGLIVFVVNIFWSFAQISQSMVDLQIADDIWSGQLKQIFSSGIRESEYMVSRIISSCMVSFIILSILITMAVYIFNLQIVLQYSYEFLAIIFVTLLSSIALSILVASIILLVGQEYSFLSWSAIQIFILLSAPFYPVSIFPEFLQGISWVMPYTAVFEAIRSIVTLGYATQNILVYAAVVSLVYLILSFPLYMWSFKRAKKNGNIVKMS